MDASPKMLRSGEAPVSKAPPALSIGLAVRNGGHLVKGCIESILCQDFTDLELVVCDNASDDGTTQRLEKYARADQRIRLIVNPSNIGSHDNMRRALDNARGTFFRWVSHDDWLEPRCLSSCVRALESRPDAIGVTSWFTIHTPDGKSRYEEYKGEFPDSSDAAQRFERMLWFFHAGDAKYDPIYGMYRRDYIKRTGFPHASERTDWLICTELALLGPIIHVNERLANRNKDYARIDRAAFRRRLDPRRAEQLKTSSRGLSQELYALAISAHLSDAQLRRCRRAVRRFRIQEQISTARSRLSDARHRIFGS
jgi:glycosyltransferase involved in cell wall biosynthesis